MSLSHGNRGPGWRGRLILRELAEPKAGVRRPHFAERNSARKAGAAPCAEQTEVLVQAQDADEDFLLSDDALIGLPRLG